MNVQKWGAALVFVFCVNDGLLPFVFPMQPCLEFHLPFCTCVSPYASTNLKPTTEFRLGLWTQPSTHPSCPNFSNTEAYSWDPYSFESCSGQLWPFRVLTGEREHSMSWLVLVIVEMNHATMPALNSYSDLAFSWLPYCSLSS